MAKAKVKRVRLHTDEKNLDLYLQPEYTDATKTVYIQIDAHSMISVMESTKKNPWECFISAAITFVSQQYPQLFAHPVLYVHTIGSRVYIVDRFKNGTAAHAVRYSHSFLRGPDYFDSMTTANFLKKFPNGIEFSLFTPPAMPKTKGDFGHSGERRKYVPRGARRRAELAGLIPKKAA